MPKEVINHPESHDTRGPDGEIVMVYTNPSVSVHWGNVYQGGREAVPGNVVLQLSEFPSVTGEEFKAAESWPPPPEREITAGPFSREQINKLIKTLRRARDAAFGRDE